MGPNLTPKQRAKLEAEISAFDSKKTKALIERNAIGKKDVNAYNEYTDLNEGNEAMSANQDTLPYDETVRKITGTVDFDLLNAKMEINEVLSFRQKQVWNLCMRRGMSAEEASATLNISEKTVTSYLRTALKKVKEHFE